MFKAVLFDLDGTLLPMDMEIFMEEYFKRLTDDFSDYYHPESFKSYIGQATLAMIKNTQPYKTNQEVFMETFIPLVNHRADELIPMFDRFYNQKFNELAGYTKPSPLAAKTVAVFVARGCRLVLATNPLFPAVATKARMGWAGIAHFPWELITTYENSHFCKPNPAYYKEILQKLNLKAEEVLMVGNDPLEDLAAGELGIKTYLVTDCLANRIDSPYKPDASGTLEDLYHAAQNDFKGVF